MIENMGFPKVAPDMLPGPVDISPALPVTTRQLLELAAKGAQILLHIHGIPGREIFMDISDETNHKLWNPLRDDGDAMRLSVICHIHFRHMSYLGPEHSVQAGVDGYWLVDVPANGDPFAAARRAIVEIAARLGLARLAHEQQVAANANG